MMHHLVEPSPDCHRLQHAIQTRRRDAGTGKQTFCAVCTLGYEMALTTFDGDEDKADNFVRDLRRQVST